MKPAASIILFTTIAGAAQGVALVLAVTTLLGTGPRASLSLMLWAVAGMLVVALVASFFHLGHPLRAWRAALMWRTSWMSREVILLPTFIALIGAWALLGGSTDADPLFAWMAIVGALALWYCTAMIYGCIRFIQEWAHPLTVVNYVTLGLASGVVTAGALSVLSGEHEFAQAISPWALAATGLAWVTRSFALRRNARLKPQSTTQSATGINSGRVVQKSMGFTGGSFNTREFFHGAPVAVFRSIKVGFQVLAFAVPMVLLTLAWMTASPASWLLALAIQALGLLAERWFFFAQAQHPQNIYYQVVS